MQAVFVVMALVPVAVLALLGLQAWMAARSRRMEGQPAPFRGTALYYFWSPTCGPCRPVTKIVDAMAAEGAPVVKVDVSRELDLAMRFGVMATPTTVLVRDGTIARVLLGPQPEQTLRALVAAA